MAKPQFTFIDLFAGIGGFHAVLSAMGGKCVYAVDVNSASAAVYERNWGINPLGDITADANDATMHVPPHDVLCAGFPCQPFSKSGKQLGMEETRGTLYWNILKIVQAHHPKLIVLENVRNLAGPRHTHELEVIVQTLRVEGYRVSEKPAVFSPHLLPPQRGGRPQTRDRVYIVATYLGREAKATELVAPLALHRTAVDGWRAEDWELSRHTPLESAAVDTKYSLSDVETLWIDAWADFVRVVRARGGTLPGFPIWADAWVDPSDVNFDEGTPDWKVAFLRKNAEFYAGHQKALDRWSRKWGVFTDAFPPSRRKFEWQAQSTGDLWDTVMHLRPSGLRAKAPTYVPALVAITQTSILGPLRRRLTPREAARLQGLPDWFDFGDQSDADTYRQLGNGVSIGALWYVMKQHVQRDRDFLRLSAPRLLRAIENAPDTPDDVLRTSPR